MCKSLNYYPYVELKDGTKKVIFNTFVHVDRRDTFDRISNFKEELKLAKFGLSSIKSFNQLFLDNNIKDIISMIQVPCGCCSECLTSSSKQWAFRILKEAELYENNFFVTLTYDNDNLFSMNLDKSAISDFNKKLKVYLDRCGCRSDFRFYGVGEYGSKNARPHYHVIYFNLDLPDLKFLYIDANGNLIFESKLLNKIWSKGYVYIGGVDVGSACYVARYCDKKKRLSKSQKLDLLNKGLVPEFAVMSRRPGIGSHYLSTALEKWNNNSFDFYIKGSKWSLPLYYSKKLKNLVPKDVLNDYDIQARLKSDIVISRLLDTSDFVDNLDFIKVDEVNTKRSL